MVSTLLFELILAACLGCGPYPAQSAAVYESYAPTPCACPKDSPCKKGCQKDDCCCKGSFSAVRVPYAPVCCPPVASTWAAQPAPCAPSCCPAPVMVTYPLPNPPMPPAPSRLYQVELKLGKDLCPKLMLPLGSGSVIHHLPASPKFEGVCQIGLHLSDAEDGRLKVDMHLGQVRGSGGFPTLVVSKGSKTVHPDTSTNMILSGTDPEPVSVGLFVKAIEMQVPNAVQPTPATCLPYPVAIDEAPVPAVAPTAVYQPAPPMAYIPPSPLPPYGYPPQQYTPPPMPGPICPPHVSIPEPMPISPPAPPITRCVATVPARACSSAHVKLVRCCHKSLVAMKCGDVCLTGVRMTIDKGACGALTVAAGKQHVHVKGKKWKAQADSVEILPDGQVVLCGHVKLVSDKIGVCASVKAEKLCVQVKDGKFISVGGKE